jgi:uncharacterized protein with PQ loop repeat
MGGGRIEPPFTLDNCNDILPSNTSLILGEYVILLGGQTQVTDACRFLVVLLFFSYTPQYIKIISKKSTVGVSAGFIGFNVAANFALLSSAMSSDHCVKTMQCFTHGKISIEDMRSGLLPMTLCCALLVASLGLWVSLPSSSAKFPV